MHWAGVAVGDEGEPSRVAARLGSDGAQRARHLGVRDAMNAGGRFEQGEAKGIGDAPVPSRQPCDNAICPSAICPDGMKPSRTLASVRVGAHRPGRSRPGRAATRRWPVRHGARRRRRAGDEPPPEPTSAMSIEGPAADSRRRACSRPGQHPAADLVVRPRETVAVLDQGRLRRGPAHVERDRLRVAEPLRDRRARGDARGRAGLESSTGRPPAPRRSSRRRRTA